MQPLNSMSTGLCTSVPSQTSLCSASCVLHSPAEMCFCYIISLTDTSTPESTMSSMAALPLSTPFSCSPATLSTPFLCSGPRASQSLLGTVHLAVAANALWLPPSHSQVMPTPISASRREVGTRGNLKGRWPELLMHTHMHCPELPLHMCSLRADLPPQMEALVTAMAFGKQGFVTAVPEPSQQCESWGGPMNPSVFPLGISSRQVILNKAPSTLLKSE